MTNSRKRRIETAFFFFLISKVPQWVQVGNFEPRTELDKPLENLSAMFLGVKLLELLGLQLFELWGTISFCIGYGLSLQSYFLTDLGDSGSR